MSCNCNTDNTTDLGCFCSCDDINTGLLATATGLHYVEIKFLDGQINLELDLIEDDEIILEFDKNENYKYTFSITNPNNETLCYQFKTQFCV